MRYALIRKLDISNGDGIGVSLFVQGCHFHCKDCFNEETWDFDGGRPWTSEAKDFFLSLAGREHIVRVSILGGCPLCDENVGDVYSLLEEIKQMYPEKKVWVYTGYTWEELSSDRRSKRFEILKYIDVLVDGRFDHMKKDLSLAYKGSINQRVIDVQKTLETGDIVLYK